MKKSLALLLALVLLLSIAGCSSTGTTTADNTSAEILSSVMNQIVELSPTSGSDASPTPVPVDAPPPPEGAALGDGTAAPEVPEEFPAATEAPAPEDAPVFMDEPAPAEPEAAPSDGLRPEFKEAMDAYEAFYDEYCTFMAEYSENPTDLSLLVKYGELMGKAGEMDAAFSKWEEDSLSDEELKYYLEVNNRVMQKLVDVAG